MLSKECYITIIVFSLILSFYFNHYYAHAQFRDTESEIGVNPNSNKDIGDSDIQFRDTGSVEEIDIYSAYNKFKNTNPVQFRDIESEEKETDIYSAYDKFKDTGGFKGNSNKEIIHTKSNERTPTNAKASNDAIQQLGNVFDDAHKQQLEKFGELGEKGFLKDCLELMNADKFKSLKGLCERMTESIKNEYEQKTSLASTSIITYKTYNDRENGFSIEYPSDWHVTDKTNGLDIFKGTRALTLSTFDTPGLALLSTYQFGDIIFDETKEDGAKIIEKPSSIEIDDESAVTFVTLDNEGYQKGYQTMKICLIHDDLGYVFQYTTLKDNFDEDYDTIIHFLESIDFN